jgi:hypothetical protein
LDGKKFELFSQEAVMSPGETRRLRGLQVDNFVDASERLTIDYDRRSLQEGCSFFDVIEVVILVDSNLCAYAGSYENASTLSQSIVAAASEYYEVTGLCKKLMISYLEIYCNPATDPASLFYPCWHQRCLRRIQRATSKVRGFVKSTVINADVVHLFHGHDFTGINTIGCAYIENVCKPSGYSVCVYSGSLDIQSKIVLMRRATFAAPNTSVTAAT